MKTLEELFETISDNIKNEKELIDLKNIVLSYNGDDWKEYINFSESKYTRNLIFKNDYVEMLLICWNINQQSGIHDHPKNGCILRILDGILTEEVYRIDNNKPVLDTKNICYKNNISYQMGELGLHNIVNKNDKTISLHIYSPPNHKPKYYN